jgi:hypothetical protein
MYKVIYSGPGKNYKKMYDRSFPGAFLFLFLLDHEFRSVVKAENAGWETRDCISLVGRKTLRCFILHKRHPVLQSLIHYGCGTLNIDAARIFTTDRLNGGATSSEKAVLSIDGYDRPWMHDEEKLKEFQEGAKERVEKAQALGRWPANFILIHSKNCKKVGMKKAEDWKCSKHCPIKNLDAQSGIRKGWSSQNHNNFNMYGGNSFNSSSTSRSGFHEGYNDTGGASRFFYNARGWTSAIRYLTQLSGAPCLNLTKYKLNHEHKT